MAEYIEREKVLSKATPVAGCFSDMISAYDVIMLPAADGAPVRHGRWIPAVYVGDCCYRCSECQFLRDAYLLGIGNYCPNCGAKMDEG